MEKENITGLLLKAIDLFSSLYSLLPRIEGGSYDLGPDEAIEEEWEEVGPGLDSIIGDDENLVKLIEYLKAERNAGHSIDPQIQELREWLWRAVTLVPGVNKATITGLTNHSDKYCNWLDWINRYYPPEQSKQGPGQEEPIKQDVLPFELNTEEARKYFPRAEKAGYINGHKWIGRNVRLAYFCSKVYDNPRPINALEDYFGVKKLSASISQAELEPKRSDVIEWRKKIDDSIFYD